MEVYRAETSHWVDGRQVNRKGFFQRSSEEGAKEHFHKRLKADRTIQEAALFRDRDHKLVDEYIGYC